MASKLISHLEFPAKDPEASARFYETVFGWNIVRAVPNYLQFQTIPKQQGGAFVERQIAAKGAGVVPYVTVDSIDDALARIEKAGGKTIEKRTVIEEGKSWWALFSDPAGNEIGLYEG
jgi:hypothetical protein